MNTYNHLKAIGIDMSWYDKVKKRNGQLPGTIPLFDQTCSRLSIYLLKTDGTLWTLDGSEPYAQVRETTKQLTKPIYLCASCKNQYSTLAAAHGHY